MLILSPESMPTIPLRCVRTGLMSVLSAFMWISISGLELHAQTPIGVLLEERDGPILQVELDDGAQVRSGMLAFVVYWDDAAQSWIPKAEVAVEAVNDGRATVRTIATPGGLAPAAGDRVVVYENRRPGESRLRVSPGQYTLLRGQSVGLVAELVQPDGSPLQQLAARWRSSDPDVVHVTPEGRAFGLRQGDAVVVAEASAGLSALTHLRVTAPTLAAPDSIVGFVGVVDTIRLTPSSDPLPGDGEGLSWSIRDPDVASVSSGGILTPSSPGITEVEVTGLSVNFRIPVRVHPRPSEVEFHSSIPRTSITAGQLVEMVATVEFEDGGRVERVIPRIESADPLLLDPVGEGSVVVRREGESSLTLRAAGETVNWEIPVHEPTLAIELPVPIVPLAEPVRVSANHVDAQGEVLGPAGEVAWESLDPEVLRVRDGFLEGVEVGRAMLVARSGGLVARRNVYVLGDLLVSTREGGATSIRTLTLDDGSLHPLPAGSPEGREPALSPQGEWIAFVVEGRLTSRIHLVRPDGSEPRPATREMPGGVTARLGLYRQHRPTWSPDGETLYFLANPRGNYALHAADIRTGQVRVLVDGNRHLRSISVDPFTGDVVVEETRGSDASDVLLARPDGSGLTRIFDGSDYGWGPYLYENPILSGEGNAMVARRSRHTISGEGDELVQVRPLATESSDRVVTLVPAEPWTELRHAVSPGAGHTAFLRIASGRDGDHRIHIFSRERAAVRPVELEGSIEILDLTWASERSTILREIIR